jgi:hypothetical protein
MGEKVLVRLTGVISQLLKKFKRGAYEVHTFAFKGLDGQEYTIESWNAIDKQFIGQVVAFDANHDTQYKSYMLKGEITLSNEKVPQTAQAVNSTPSPASSTQAPETGVTKPRGRKPKAGTIASESNSGPVTATNAQTPVTETIATPEAFRAPAETIVAKNLAFARAYLGPDATPEAVAITAQTLQAAMTTLYIEANKQRRVDDWKK